VLLGLAAIRPRGPASRCVIGRAEYASSIPVHRVWWLQSKRHEATDQLNEGLSALGSPAEPSR
jgi:hypothetical protein